MECAFNRSDLLTRYPSSQQYMQSRRPHMVHVHVTSMWACSYTLLPYHLTCIQYFVQTTRTMLAFSTSVWQLTLGCSWSTFTFKCSRHSSMTRWMGLVSHAECISAIISAATCNLMLFWECSHCCLAWHGDYKSGISEIFLSDCKTARELRADKWIIHLTLACFYNNKVAFTFLNENCD